MSQHDSEPHRETMLSALSAAQPTGHLSRLQMAVRAFAIAVPVLGAMPTAMNLYYSWMHDIPFSEVAHKLQQYDLWTRNFDCKIDYKELSTGQGTRVNVGACPKSGDIAIKIATANGRASYEWIAFEKLRQPAKTASLIELIATSAMAEEAPKSPGSGAGTGNGAPVRLAQAGMEVVCQAKQGHATIIRIIKEGGRCFREQISAFQGKVEKREEVPCNTSCPSSR